MSDNFPFDTSGAIDFFSDNRQFGRHYTREEDLTITETSDGFFVDPEVKISLDIKLSTGTYLVLVSYGYSMSGTNRNFVSSVELDGNQLGELHKDEMQGDQGRYTTRTFQLILEKDEYNIELLFGPENMPATAHMFDAAITIWKAHQ